MKNLLISLLFLTSGYIFSNPVWVEYYIQVDSPKAAGKIVQATDNLMSSDYVKKNFKGSLHLNTWIANGDDDSTHVFAVLQPSMTEHYSYMQNLQQSKSGQDFFDTLRANSVNTSERINSFIETYGTPTNDDIYWILHEFSAQPSDLERIVRAHQKMNEGIKDDFPGQFGLSSVAYGSGDVTHILTVGYSSIAELESWEDQVATNKPVQDFLKIMDKMVTWKGSKVLTNSKVYDSASDLEQFVTKDFE
tara:strand:+ start:664 stop:1407 length:744 start_codon:yes stop_codon:yes gene_type:complete